MPPRGEGNDQGGDYHYNTDAHVALTHARGEGANIAHYHTDYAREEANGDESSINATEENTHEKGSKGHDEEENTLDGENEGAKGRDLANREVASNGAYVSMEVESKNGIAREEVNMAQLASVSQVEGSHANGQNTYCDARSKGKVVNAVTSFVEVVAKVRLERRA